MSDKPSWLSDDGDAGPAWASTESPSSLHMTERQSGSAPTPSAPTSTTTTAAITGLSPMETSSKDTNLESEETTATESSFERKTWCEFITSSLGRDGRLILIVILILILSNIEFGWYAVYPFVIFSTWIHETCHGMAALLVGYKVDKLELFSDGSGLAYYRYALDEPNRQGFVSSAGYQGTAVIGCLLLLIRRTKRGPRAGLMFLALCSLLTICFWIRNAFGIIFMGVFTFVLVLSAWFLSRFWMSNLYTLLAVTTALNAIFAVRQLLFGNDFQVNGQDFPTDAHTMAELKFGSRGMWAFIWLGLAIGLAILGVFCAIPGPDERADLSGCYSCQKAGCFACCNAPGMGLCGKHFSADRRNNDTNTDDDPVV
eukprot:scaffold6750_cov160-Amphora_coffeaeformis.AAC.6